MKFAETAVYTFEVKGKPVYQPVGKGIDAMVEANKHFGSLPQGAWMDARPGHYYWVEGNFFD